MAVGTEPGIQKSGNFSRGWKPVSFTLHLLPFAGIAFLWFIGYGGSKKFQEDLHWRDYLLFYEYFHGDNGAGFGASHQTGWTGIIARAMRLFATSTAEQFLENGKIAGVVEVEKEAQSGRVR